MLVLDVRDADGLSRLDTVRASLPHYRPRVLHPYLALPCSSVGDGEHGQLGHGEGAGRRPHPSPRAGDELSGVRLLQVECGTHHTAAVTAAGQLFTWGAGGFGQLGHGARQGESVPRAVSALRFARRSAALAREAGKALLNLTELKKLLLVLQLADRY